MKNNRNKVSQSDEVCVLSVVHLSMILDIPPRAQRND